jgi:hypothetical protein
MVRNGRGAGVGGGLVGWQGVVDGWYVYLARSRVGGSCGRHRRGTNHWVRCSQCQPQLVEGDQIAFTI